jgi:hypothetical protein
MLVPFLSCFPTQIFYVLLISHSVGTVERGSVLPAREEPLPPLTLLTMWYYMLQTNRNERSIIESLQLCQKISIMNIHAWYKNHRPWSIQGAGNEKFTSCSCVPNLFRENNSSVYRSTHSSSSLQTTCRSVHCHCLTVVTRGHWTYGVSKDSLNVFYVKVEELNDVNWYETL